MSRNKLEKITENDITSDDKEFNNFHFLLLAIITTNNRITSTSENGYIDIDIYIDLF